VNEGRLSHIAEINVHFHKLLMSSKGQSNADVCSAYNLNKDFCLKLEKILSNIFRKEVSLNTHVDPLLFGGIVVEMDGFRFDASISGNLNQLSYHMKGAR